MKRWNLAWIAVVALVACKPASKAPPAAAAKDAAAAGGDAAAVAAIDAATPIDAAAPIDAAIAVVEPPTPTSVHVELARVIADWIRHPDRRPAMYAENFEHKHFLDGDGVPAETDKATWLNTVVAPTLMTGLSSIGCWLEPGSHTDWVEEGECRATLWYNRPTGAAKVPYDSGSWQQTWKRGSGGVWQIVKEEMTSRTRFDTEFSSSSSLGEVDASSLGSTLTLAWAAVDLEPVDGKPSSQLVLTIADDKGKARAFTLDVEAGACAAGEKKAGALFTLRCTGATTVELTAGAPKKDELEIERTELSVDPDAGAPQPKQLVTVKLPKHAKVAAAPAPAP